MLRNLTCWLLILHGGVWPRVHGDRLKLRPVVTLGHRLVYPERRGRQPCTRGTAIRITPMT